MLESEKFALAARLHVLLRRKLGRVTDVEWMVKNRDYAQELLRLARGQRDAELDELADRCEAVLAPRADVPPRRPLDAALPTRLAPARAPAAPAAPRYVGSLR